MRSWLRVGVATLAITLGGPLAGCSSGPHPPRASDRPTTAPVGATATGATATATTATATTNPRPVVVTTGAGPGPQWDCAFNPVTAAFTGAFGTASAIGWEGNHQGVVTCLGGTFFVQDGINRDYGFGLYDGSRTTWADADGYLPAQVTTFHRSGATIAITEFADRLELGGKGFVAVYSRVKVTNPTAHAITADPEPSAGMVELTDPSDAVGPHSSAEHDYVVAVDRFGHTYPWPDAQALADAGGYDSHFTHMRAFWDGQLAQGAAITTPDGPLDDAYRSGFITTEIARSGNALHTGVNGYESEFSHDVIGILGTLFAQGHVADAPALLLEARSVLGGLGQYVDATWTYAWPWAVYLMKTGDLALVKANFATEGPEGRAQPSIEDTADAIAADRTGPGGIMELTDDIDSHGYWTVDDEEALTGLAAYGYLAQRVGNRAEERWATGQYDSLLAAMNRTLEATIARFHLDYLPCSMVEPNTANRCANPTDANWAAPFLFGRWPWEATIFGAPVSGPALDLIGATYAWGFSAIGTRLPPNTFGGYPPDFYSSAYNAGYGAAALNSSGISREQGISSYIFMIAHDQSGPNSWWESSTAPSPASPWVGDHPAAGQGASPHAWGMAEANLVLLDSLATERADGTLVVGLGVPTKWLLHHDVVRVDHFPTTDGRRVALAITARGRTVTLTLHGRASGPVVFALPAFLDDMARASTGRLDERAGSVTVPAGTTTVSVVLDRAPE